MDIQFFLDSGEFSSFVEQEADTQEGNKEGAPSF